VNILACAMSGSIFGWSEEQLAYRDAVRRFVDTNLVPLRNEVELGDTPPYDLMRSFYKAFDLDSAAMERFERSLDGRPSDDDSTRSAAETLIPMIEFSRHSPGLVTAMGVSTSLASGAILSAGTREQKERWASDLLTLQKIGSWAVTEPDAGSDAFGSMRATARPDGNGGWILNGSKTFITNAPFADTIVFICKLDDGRPPREREVMTFVLDRGMPGLEQSAPLRKMGMHSSPTGEVTANDVRAGWDRLLCADRRAGAVTSTSRREAKSAFSKERASVTAMALGIIDRCLELSVNYAKVRTQFGRPLGDFQLIQLKLAQMEVARMNVENLVLRYIASADAGIKMPLAEASAMKLYAAQSATHVALEAVQVFGGNGYMAEHQVEQLCRDAKVLQIYGGSDEIQVTHIARGLLLQARP
jgi:alkylation response protein AidB-like acyl-CoA dehydrogenase